MIGVAIVARGVESDNNLRPHPAQVRHNLTDGFRWVGLIHGVHDLRLGERLDVWLDPRHVYVFAEDGRLVTPAAYALAA